MDELPEGIAVPGLIILGFAVCLCIGHRPWRITKALLGACLFGFITLLPGAAARLTKEGQHVGAWALIGLVVVIMSAAFWLNVRGGKP